ERGHPTAHGGVLNAIVTCEVGHAEVTLEEDTLRLWFVGGGSETTHAEPVPDHSLALKVAAPGGGPARALILQPSPLALAGETVGSCSRFEGRAPWLRGLAKFTATGTATFKGQKRPL